MTVKEEVLKKRKNRNFLSRKKKAIAQLKLYRNKDGTQKENKIEKKVRELLDSMGLRYEQEKPFIYKGKKRIFDFYVNTGLMSFCIECDGDYWHATDYQEGEKKYSELTKIQRKNLRNDKFKNLMMHELGIPLLRFSETEIKRDINYIEERIKNLIN